MNKKLKYLLHLFYNIVILILCVCFLIMFLTYHENDPSSNTINNSDIILNKFGIIGSYIADFSLQIFGITSYFIIFLFVIISFLNIRKLNSEFNENNLYYEIKYNYSIYLKIIMFIFFILFSCAISGKIIEVSFNNKINIKVGAIGYYLNLLTISFNRLFLISFYIIGILLSINILVDFEPRKFFSFIKNISLLIYKTFLIILKFIYFIIGKIIVFLLPNKIFNYLKSKIENLLNKKKIKNDEKINVIEHQNEKIKLLEKYIKDEKNKDKIKRIEKEYKLDLYSRVEEEKKAIEKEKQQLSYGDNISYKLPSVELLTSSKNKIIIQTKDELKNQATDLIRVLNEYKISGKIIGIKAGPIITLHEFEPAPGIKSSRIISSSDDIARNLKVKSTRISVIPERNVLGIELPNKTRNIIYLKDILESDEYKNSTAALPLILGVNIAGEPVIMDLVKCPHLLIAGTTGSGKSVGINTMILSLLYKFTPNECKFIMIDPKILELSVYQNIPHLLTPVVTDPKKAILALKWVVAEMENRYRIMSSVGVRNIYGYNDKIRESIKLNKNLSTDILVGYDKKSDPIYEKREIKTEIMPFIVVVVDEMADLMLTAGKDIDALVQRIAQMARAAGIHIIMSTQRPSTDIITGVIKANFPSRISFLVSSKIDSRVIINEHGAEQLLGFGDMLYNANGGKINRAHGPFTSDYDVQNVVNSIIKQGFKPNYINTILKNDEEEDSSSSKLDDSSITISGNKNNSDDNLYKEAIEIIKRDKKVSISYIQRQLRIGYNKAATIIEKMEKEGVISSVSSTGKREIIED